MTRLLGSWLTARRQTSPSSGSGQATGWQPLPDDIAEWMGMKPYEAEAS
jgi:hypothetical protein